MTEDEAMDTVSPVEEAVVEPIPEKQYDLEKVQAAYEKMKGSDVSKMTRVEYSKYQWLEERLCDAGLIGILAWEEEFGI